MIDELDTAGKTCESCKHWQRSAPPPGQAADLGGNVGGECRERLHAAPVLARNMEGQPVLVGWFPSYPSVPAVFPACGQYRGRLELRLALER